MNWQLSGLWVVQVVDVPDKLPDNNGPAPGGLTQALGAGWGPAPGAQPGPNSGPQLESAVFRATLFPLGHGVAALSPRGCTATYRPPVLRWAPPPLRNRGFKHLFVPPVRQFR